MRRVKADVYLDARGNIQEAVREGFYRIDNSEEHTGSKVPGFIVVPLKKGRSRAKGSELERDVAKAFSTWLYNRDDVLRRTPLSGGWGSGRLGDISIDPAIMHELKIKPPELYVECKNHADLLGESFLRWVSTGKPKDIDGWLKKAKEDAGDRFIFLVLKGNNTEPWVLFPPREYYAELEFSAAVPNAILEFKGWTMFPLAILHGLRGRIRENILGHYGDED